MMLDDDLDVTPPLNLHRLFTEPLLAAFTSLRCAPAFFTDMSYLWLLEHEHRMLKKHYETTRGHTHDIQGLEESLAVTNHHSQGIWQINCPQHIFRAAGPLYDFPEERDPGPLTCPNMTYNLNSNYPLHIYV